MVQRQLAFNAPGYVNTILQGKRPIKSFNIISFDGVAYDTKGNVEDRLTIKANVLDGGLRYVTVHTSDDHFAPLPFCAIDHHGSVREYNPLERGRIDVGDNIFLISYNFSGGLTGHFESKLKSRSLYAKYTRNYSLDYLSSHGPDGLVSLSRLVYSNSSVANISRYGASKEPTEVFSVKILLSDREFSLKARSIVFSHEVAPTYCTPSIIRTESDEFVVSVRDGTFLPIAAKIVQRPRDYSRENQNLGLGDNLRLRISRLSRDGSGLRHLSDPSLNLEVLEKLFGITSISSPEPVRLLDAIIQSVALGEGFDHRAFFASAN